MALEAIAASTKISITQLQALERDDIRSLPGGVFNRGIVQGYCRVVGLDDTQWLQRFQTEFHGEEANWTQFAEAVKRNRIPSSGPQGSRWIGVAIMFLALLAIAWAAWKYLVQPRMAGSHLDTRTSLSMSRPPLQSRHPDGLRN